MPILIRIFTIFTPGCREAMQIFKSNILNPQQHKQVEALWNTEYPKRLQGFFKGFIESIAGRQVQHYVLQDEQDQLLGWAVHFDREGEHWFSIIVDSQQQKKGYGSQLLEKLKADYDALNGWAVDHNEYHKQDGTSYRSPIPFYLKNGFEVVPQQRKETEILSTAKIHWVR